MSESQPSGGRSGLMFIFVTLLIDIIGIGLIIPILPELVLEFTKQDPGTAARMFGIMGALFTAMQFLCSPIQGAVSDQVGRKPVLLVSLLGSALSYGILALAGSLPVLFLGRALAGAAGGSLTVATTYIVDVSAPEDRGKNFGLVGAAFGLGFILGPALGGLLGHFGPRLPFWVAGGLALANALYGWLRVPESHPLERRRAFTWKQANPIHAFALLVRDRRVTWIALALFFSWMSQSSLQNVWVLYTKARFGWDMAHTGTSLAVVGLGSAIVQGGLIRVLLPRLGDRRAVYFGLGLTLLAQIGYGLATQGWMMYAIIAFASLGGISGPAVQAILSRQVDPREQGAVQGAVTSLTSLTGIISPLIAAPLFAHFSAKEAVPYVPGAPFFLAALYLLVSMGLMVFVFRKVLPATPEPAAASA